MTAKKKPVEPTSASKLLNFIDVLPGLKTELTLLVQFLFNTLAAFNVYEATPDQLASVNGLLAVVLALTVGLRTRRKVDETK